MTKPNKSPQEQEAIVAEYLLGNATYRHLGQKYGIDFRIIHWWVMKFQNSGKSNVKKASKEEEVNARKEPQEMEQLREALRLEKLRSELYSTMIDIAEKDLKISIRKKFGTKQ